MNGNFKDALKKRLDENYATYLKSLQTKTATELIAMAPEITAAQQLHEELAGVCDDGDAEYLLQFDDPLEALCGLWADALTDGRMEEIRHLVWEVRNKGLYETEQPKWEEVYPRPKMLLSENEYWLVLIAGKAANTLYASGWQQQAAELFQRVMGAEDRESALRIIKRCIDIEII